MVAGNARADDVLPDVGAATGAGPDVVQCQLPGDVTAVLAREAVPVEYPLARQPSSVFLNGEGGVQGSPQLGAKPSRKRLKAEGLSWSWVQSRPFFF